MTLSSVFQINLSFFHFKTWLYFFLLKYMKTKSQIQHFMRKDEPRQEIETQIFLRRLMLKLSEKSALSKPQKSKKNCKDATALNRSSRQCNSLASLWTFFILFLLCPTFFCSVCGIFEIQNMCLPLCLQRLTSLFLLTVKQTFQTKIVPPG